MRLIATTAFVLLSLSAFAQKTILNITLGEAVSSYQFVYIKLADGKAYKADPNDATKSPAVGVCLVGGSVNGVTQAQIDGAFNNPGATFVPGLTYYLDAAIPGNITDVAPANSQAVGVAITSTDLVLSGASAVNIAAPTAATITGTTLNSGVTISSLETVGTITTGVWNGTAVSVARGGTGETTANAAMNALLPSQAGQAGNALITDGTNTSFSDVGIPKYLVLGSNAASSSVTLANVSGMSFTAIANKTYIVELVGRFQSVITTTGIGLALDIPSGTITGSVQNELAATTATFHAQIADAAVVSATSGVRANNTNAPILGKWLVLIGGTGGTVQLMLRSEIATSAVTLQSPDTIMIYTKIN